MSFADALARLDADALAALLAARPDVLVEPVPASIGQLAQRLGGVESLSAALQGCHRDLVTAGTGFALLGAGATVPAVAELLRSPEPLVRAAVDELCARGLAWWEGGAVALPERLGAHFAATIGPFRRVAVIARQVAADEVRAAVHALGGKADGLRKPELTGSLTRLLSDREAVVRAVRGLPPASQAHLEQVLRADGYHSIAPYGRADPAEALVRSGLGLRVHHRAELPLEVAVSIWLAGQDVALTGPPQLPAAAPAPAAGARAAAEDLLRGVTALLDEARAAGVAALKKGGVGSRERTRLAKRLSAAPSDVALWIDLAAAAGLLALAGAAYAPTPGYEGWREAEPGERWSALARVWWRLDLAPTYRRYDDDDDTEVPPPVPLGSAAGMVRRALLRAAAGGASVLAAGSAIGWYCPFHGYDPGELAPRVTAAVAEARALGVVVGDAVSELGRELVAGGEDLGRRCAALLPASSGMLVLQSDLTAVVSGQPSAAAARVLSAAAVVESRGAAATWRFTPASVRGALDAGWTSERLREELRAVAGAALPQPLGYLIADVARRHGSVRVRGVRSCVVGGEAEIAEILHTRALASLRLAALAPTVLAGPSEVGQVLAALRAAGFAPVEEDAGGVVVVEERAQRRATSRVAAARPRPRTDPTELAHRLLAAPAAVVPAPTGVTADLATLAPQLDSAEIALLADALHHGRDVSILYRDKQGNRTVRDIRPEVLDDRWLDAWCHLRRGQRDFALAGIEAVAPPSQQALDGSG